MTKNNILTQNSVEENFITEFLDSDGDRFGTHELTVGNIDKCKKIFFNGILHNLASQENVFHYISQTSYSKNGISKDNSININTKSAAIESSIHGELALLTGKYCDSTNKSKISTMENVIGNGAEMFMTDVMCNSNKLSEHVSTNPVVYLQQGMINYGTQLLTNQKFHAEENKNMEHMRSQITPAQNTNVFSKSKHSETSNVSSYGNREKIYSNRIIYSNNTDACTAINKTQERPQPYSIYEILNYKSTLPEKESENFSADNINNDNAFVHTRRNREKMFDSGVTNFTNKAQQNDADVKENRNETISPITRRNSSYSEQGIFNYDHILVSPDNVANTSKCHGGDADSSNANGHANGISGDDSKKTETPAHSRIIARVKKSRSFALLSDAAGEDRAAKCHDADESERRVLVIYTGGTIGMVKNSDGVLEPIQGEFEGRARKFPQLHDEAYWRKRFVNDETQANSLVLPEVKDLKTRIVYEINEKEVLLDSSNITPEEWTSIAKDIMTNYDLFDGFVVLHGTDTLAYTASALSFMFENIGKPVVITGSQIPIFEPRSDGADNFVSAIIVAGGLNIPEVTVLFGSKLFRGNRTRKISSHNFDAFDSPNFVPLVEFGIDIEVNTKAIFRPNTIEKCRLHERMSKNVALIRIFPSISPAVLRAFLQPPIEGVVVESYGSGNIPSNKEIFAEIESAVKRGVVVVNITQCASGSVAAPVYETGRLVHACGVISGYDMTAESALAKLSYVLTKDEWEHEKKIEMMTSNIRGELTNVLNSISLEDNNSLIDALASSLKIASPKQLIEVTDKVFAALLLYAIDKEEEITIQRMQQLGAEVNSQNSEGKTPLHEAINKQNLNIVKYLLLRGANVHLKTRNGESPLLTAIHRDNHAIIRLLLNCGAHLAGSDSPAVTELLSLAARRGALQRLQSLRIAGADFTLKDETKQTALHKAVLCNKPEVVRFLLDQNIEADVLDVVGNSPLDYARQLGNQSIIDMLQ